MKYDPVLIEKKWQEFWDKTKTFHASEDERPKYYILDMFPYPSGSGLHVGHLIGYTATDVLARYHLQKGFSVLHPMGWDSFGLPAEQYAIRTGTHPAITTTRNIANFKKQMKSVGYAYDWDREIMTSDPKYYQWTQYLFTKLYEKGLAYEAEMLVNYCPALKSVLANEEVENGKSKEGGYPVERRPLKQWILKITAYADRLLEDLELLDWPEGLKKLQKNWIGKSEGVEICFEAGKEKVEVFTTRPDTLFGVSYLVLSPEHPLVKVLTTLECQKSVESYLDQVKAKSDLERTELNKEKTGVFLGAYATCDVTKKKIPIWVADYVLMGYGTGAVMAVPAHDARDYEFAKKYDLPIYPVIASDQELYEEKTGKMINSSNDQISLDGLEVEDAIKTMIDFLKKNQKGVFKTTYRLRDWLFSRQRYWGEPIPIIHFEDGTKRALEPDELPLTPPDIEDYKPSESGESPLAKETNWVEIQDPKTGKKGLRETNTMPQWAGSCWYYLRFCDPHNETAPWDFGKERYWLPVDLYVGGAEHAVLHLLYARFWHKVFYDLNLVHTKEPFQKLCNQGLVVSQSYRDASGAYLSADQVVEKEGKYFHWETEEPLTMQVEKMSKSKLNGVSPDEIIEEYGADALRLYALFMGPIEKEKLWNTHGVAGCRRFLNRFFEMVTSWKIEEITDPEATKLVHRLIAGVTDDLDQMLFNTCIAKMMEFVNQITKLPKYPKEVMKLAVLILAPFAPHMAEELWEFLGETVSVAKHPWPKYDPTYLQEDVINYVIQINGKLRAQIEAKAGLSKEELFAQAKDLEKIQKFLSQDIVKVIYVPNKLLNIVVK